MSAPIPAERRTLRALVLQCLAAACAAPPAGPRLSEASLLAAIRASPGEEDARLFRLADRLGLGEGELLAAALCRAVEIDPATARRVAQAQDPVGRARPLAGFLATIFAGFGCDAIRLAGGAAIASGLLTLGDEDAPLVERSVAMPLEIAAALGGVRIVPEGLAAIGPAPCPLPPAILAEARARAEQLGGRRAVLVVRSPSTRELDTVASAIAAALDSTPVVLGTTRLADHAGWLAASDSLPVLRRSLAPGECLRIDPFGAHDAPLLLLAGGDGVVEAPVPVTEWRLPLPDLAARTALWEAHGVPPPLAARAAAIYRQGAGRIAEVAERLAPADDAADWPALVAAAGAGASQLDALARRSSARVERDDLVVPAELRGGLDRLVDRIRLRDTLSAPLGAALRARYRPGVRALFTGDSGTGKTLAVHWLARRLGLPLYRVDLAAMTSKWIGETEKNLSTVLDAAQHADVILFFDEADSLFGARTEVGDSHDRFANAQTNFLLQRIEDFDGIAVLATNSRDRFDPAFVRRLDAILEFPLPDAAARQALWAAHLGTGHAVSDAELDLLAVSVDLAGGHIRNVVLGAAARAGLAERRIEARDLAAASAEEYTKLGRSAPPLPW